jgi:cytoskeleton protein RodZ
MQNVAIIEDNLYYADASAGDILRSAREHYGQSLVDIEKALRIRASQIHAIEKNNYEKLPGRVYVIGFVRSYAEYLGLNPDRMVNLYKSQMSGQSTKQHHFPAAASESRIPDKYVLATCIVLIVGLVATWSIMHQHSKTQDLKDIPVTQPVKIESKAEAKVENNFSIMQSSQMGPHLPSSPHAIPAKVPESQVTSLAPQADITDASASSIAQIPEQTPAEPQVASAQIAEEKPVISLEIVQDSWVEIRDSSGQKLVSRILKKGEAYTLKDREDLYISIGNAAGVKIALSGQSLGVMGKEAQVIRNFPINPQSIKEKYSPAPQDAINQAQ